MTSKMIALFSSLPFAFTAATATADDAKTFIEGKPDKPGYVETTVDDTVKPPGPQSNETPRDSQSNQTSCSELAEVKPVKPSPGPKPKFG